ncbi:hypothetical protein LY76DRAFT_74612 [Colletotrichum caudatum]|nr:hypothetical protein LY76DRAFT_74612 [Colletotrichum caudatum]
MNPSKGLHFTRLASGGEREAHIPGCAVRAPETQSPEQRPGGVCVSWGPTIKNGNTRAISTPFAAILLHFFFSPYYVLMLGTRLCQQISRSEFIYSCLLRAGGL